MIKRNYQSELSLIIKNIEKEKALPKLMLHACCGPCASYVLEYLNAYFDITVLYYNPNISPEIEYSIRLDELRKLIEKLPQKNKIKLIESPYQPEEFFTMAKGLENEPEGGERCFKCYNLRLLKTVQLAKDKGFDYFASTLSISPHKNAQKLNEIGEKLALEYGVKHLPNDFKKQDGYKKSVILSNEYNMYRQDWCGCVYSKIESQLRNKE